MSRLSGIVVLALAMMLSTTIAHAWSVGNIAGDNAELGRVTCGLLATYGPSRSYHDLSIAIATSPYGPLTVTMGPSRTMEVGVSSKHFADQPPEPKRAEIRTWVVAQLPAKPAACTFLLASPGYLVRTGYPDQPPMVPEEDYIAIQLDLAKQAAAVAPDQIWRWNDGALAAFNGLDAAKRKKYQKDPAVRAAAYAVVAVAAPTGLSADGKRGYCALYDSVQKFFPPSSPAEKAALAKARSAIPCT